MKYFVYIIYSQKFKRTYVGQTRNLENRLSFHNYGKVRSTKYYRPWLLLYYEEFATRSEAMNRERWYKTPTGRKMIGELIMKMKPNSLAIMANNRRE
ncbi:MAG: GIY-YIG nuclease family protein [Ignavibacteriales bacterium]|nr:GIY-YIG nuclease family protein [Ignavibacteriales bacterium]